MTRCCSWATRRSTSTQYDAVEFLEHSVDLPHGLGTPDVPTFIDMHDVSARVAAGQWRQHEVSGLVR